VTSPAQIAERVIAEIGPARVAVLGGSRRSLVEALSERGVEAALVEASLSVHDSYDLILCLDDASPRPADLTALLGNVCGRTSDVLFVPPVPGTDGATSGEAATRSTWIRWFAGHGFELDVEFDASFVEPRALRFRRGTGADHVLDGVLVHRDLLRNELTALHRSAAAKDNIIRQLQAQVIAMEQTLGWRALEWLRRRRERLLASGRRRRYLYGAFRRTLTTVADEGLGGAVSRATAEVRRAGVVNATRELGAAPAGDLDHEAQYSEWLRRHPVTGAEAARRRNVIACLRYQPLISIVTPVHDPDEGWLRRAVQSVHSQVYPRWELCLVDDASTKPHVAPVLDEYARADSRIRVQALTRGLGIAGASNAGLAMAKGEFVGLLDHDDELSVDALFEVVRKLNDDPALDLVYSDEDKLDPDGRRVDPFFKPDWSPDLLLSMNYICHFCVFRRTLLDGLAGFGAGFDGSQDYELLLRVTERTQKIAHIPKVLYHWRKIPGSTASEVLTAKPHAYSAARRALEEALRRRGRPGRVEMVQPGLYSIRYELEATPLVSIIIPTRDRATLLEQCVRSIEERTHYDHYEIVVVDNGSTEAAALDYLKRLGVRWRVCPYPGPFNFAAINNFAVRQARGEYLLFLNNDTQVIRADWLTGMLAHAQHPEVGAVGARLLYSVGHIQHAGIVLGLGGVAGHPFRGLSASTVSPFGFADVARNCTAVTAACLLMRRRPFEEVGGFDERLPIAYNDVDLCLRLRERGYVIVYTPRALLYHTESATRGMDHPAEDEQRFRARWGTVIAAGDPYYNPNLSLIRDDWSLRL